MGRATQRLGNSTVFLYSYKTNQLLELFHLCRGETTFKTQIGMHLQASARTEYIRSRLQENPKDKKSIDVKRNAYILINEAVRSYGSYKIRRSLVDLLISFLKKNNDNGDTKEAVRIL